MSKQICKLRGPLFFGQIHIKIIDRNDLFPYTCVEYINVLYFLLKIYLLSSYCKWVVFTLFGVQWMMSKRVVYLLFGWRKGFDNHRAPFARNLVPLCLMRTLRRQMNNCILKKSMFLRSLFMWSCMTGSTDERLIMDFIDFISDYNSLVGFASTTYAFKVFSLFSLINKKYCKTITHTLCNSESNLKRDVGEEGGWGGVFKT